MAKAKLLYGCGADSHYATGMHISDPYLWYQDSNGKTHVALSALEVDRGRKEAKVTHVHALEDIVAKLKAAGKKINLLSIVLWFVEEDNPHSVEVPEDFPFALGQQLVKVGVDVQTPETFFFPERTLKTQEEVAQIKAAQALNERAFYKAFNILEEAKIIKSNLLEWRGEVLTAEVLRGQMNALIAEEGGMPSDIILACGAQGADPHERGYGPLYAHELIIIDSFPRGPSGNFYYGDLTRTVLKGTASKRQQHLYDTVKKGQQLALDMIKPGVMGADIHQAVESFFTQEGYPTQLDAQGRNEGFFHGVGHSVGLEVHDKGPGISKRMAQKPLEEGLVVTVEPGLYYPEFGGVRIEDIVHITKDGITNLTTLPKELIVL